MPAYPMAVNPVFHPPFIAPQGAFPVQERRKILPFTPPPVATDDPPFPGTRLEIINSIRETWNLPHIPAQSKMSLRSFYNPKWDIPDDPPLQAENTPGNINRLQNILSSYAALTANFEYYISNARGKRKIVVIPLLPSIDNPPVSVMQQRVLKILDTHYTFTSQLLYGGLSPQALKHLTSNPTIFEPPVIVIPPTQRVGLIAFQPNAFQIGYPKRKIAFQGRNRKVGIQKVRVTPFIRIVTLVHRNRFMEEKKPGDAAVISVYCFDPTSLPERLFTPEEVRMTLYNPDGTVRVNAQALTEIETGLLSYIHQTATDDQLGVYTARFTASNFGNTGVSLRQEVFRLIED